MQNYLKLMKIFEVMWLVAAVISLTMVVIRSSNGQAYGNYIYITVFTTCVAVFMYWFKKKNRKYQEEYYKKKKEAFKDSKGEVLEESKGEVLEESKGEDSKIRR